MERRGLDMPGGRGDISMRNGMGMMLKGGMSLNGGPHSAGTQRGPGQAILRWQGGNGEPPGRRRFICHEETRELSLKPK